jgi:hypothetical protein
MSLKEARDTFSVFCVPKVNIVSFALANGITCLCKRTRIFLTLHRQFTLQLQAFTPSNIPKNRLFIASKVRTALNYSKPEY